MGTEKEKESAPPTDFKMTRLVIEAGKVFAWPLLIGCLVVVYHHPLRGVMESLALKFSEASKVSIGSLTVEVQAKARESGNPELAAQVGALSPSEVLELLHTPRGNGGMNLVSVGHTLLGKREYGLPKPDVMKALDGLEQKQFIRFQEDLKTYEADISRLRPDHHIGDDSFDWFVAVDPEGSAADRRFSEQNYSFTDLGREAANAIAKAVAAELSPPCGSRGSIP
jgi:hypothetical protein